MNDYLINQISLTGNSLKNTYKFNDECIDVLYCEVWKSDEEEFEYGQNAYVDCVELG